MDAFSPGQDACPVCGISSEVRHSRYVRHLQDLPAQGVPVTIRLSVARLRCRNQGCSRRVFAERLPAIVAPLARQTDRQADIAHLLAHGMGGRPAERVMGCLGMPASDDTALRRAPRHGWRSTPVSRSSAAGARKSEPKARQVADRSHLVQTLREKIEQALARLDRPVRRTTAAAAEAEERQDLRRGELKDSFAQVRALYEAGRTAADIVRELGLSRRRVGKWVRLVTLRPRRKSSQKASASELPIAIPSTSC